MAARHRGKKKADGGGIKGVNVPGASIMREAEASDAGFKKGGKAKMPMFAKGGKSAKRMDKAPRKAAGGSAVKYARGGSPFSSAGKGGKDAPTTGSECD